MVPLVSLAIIYVKNVPGLTVTNVQSVNLSIFFYHPASVFHRSNPATVIKEKKINVFLNHCISQSLMTPQCIKNYCPAQNAALHALMLRLRPVQSALLRMFTIILKNVWSSVLLDSTITLAFALLVVLIVMIVRINLRTLLQYFSRNY